MKKVAMTNGHRVSLADFFGNTEVRAADSAIVGSRAGALATANFDGCLLANQGLLLQKLALWNLRFFRIRSLRRHVKKNVADLQIFTK